MAMSSFMKGKGDETSILNSVNITSNIRAPGEYKYTYCGENSTESEKSFFNFATTWFTMKLTSNLSLLCSTYNNEHTAMLYLNTKDRCYLLIVYKNENESSNTNLSLIEKSQVTIPLANVSQETTAVKIFLVAENYLLLNEIDKRIILLDYTTGSYYPLFEREENDKNKGLGTKEYNIIDTYDERYIKTGKLNKYSYVFLYSKEKGSKLYKYYYFLISYADFKPNDNLIITGLDFGEGKEFTAEPFNIKVLKVSSRDKVNHLGEWYYVFVFVMRNTLFEFVSVYQKVSLNNILFNYKIYKDYACLTEMMSKISEGTQSAKKINAFMHYSFDKLSSLLFFLEMGVVLAFPFYDTYSPQDMVKALRPKKDMLNNDGQLKSTQKKGIGDAAKGNNEVTQFSPEFYFFPPTLLLSSDCKSVQLSHQNIVLALKDTVYIYKRNEPISLYQYCFYEEKLTNIICFPHCGFSFLLTSNKVFKIIYTDIFDKYTQEDITANVNVFIKRDLQYPVFELSPEELFSRFSKKFQIKTEEQSTESTACEVCGRSENTMRCSECGKTFYCSLEHYKYYYRRYHFFDCLLSKYFTYTNIQAIKNTEERYMTLYNGLLRTFGQLLNHIFKRIYSTQDYQQFLQFIIVMISIMDKFSFNLNVEEFTFQMTSKNETNDEKIIRTLFYIEAIFFYFQMNLLKCTFAMKSKLYNLADCYLKIIKSDLIPLLTRKKAQKPLTLNQLKIKSTRYKNFNFFFGIKRLFNNNDEIDLSELYLVKHLFCLSLLVKFKLKINSTIDVKESFIDIFLLFESHFSESKLKNIVPYCFFSISFYLVEIGNIMPTIKLLKRMVSSYNEKADNKLKALTFYNLGILQYALSEFRIGVHNLEISYKLIVDGKLSTIFLLYVLDSLSLAYLNQKSMFKAYILIKTSLNERNKIKTMENELQCIKLNVYLNYIIDLYEYTFVTKMRQMLKKRKEESDPHRIIKLVLGEEEREIVTSEYFVESFFKVIKFIFSLKTEMLSTLHAHNPSKQIILAKDDNHHDRTSNNIDTSITSSSFIGKELNVDKEENIDEYDEDIEIKSIFFDSLPRHDQQYLKTLKQSLFRREIVLRDPLGAIEPFNINYHPIYSEELIEIIRMLKSNFLLKEIFYCFQNEKWRDDYYNYSPDYCLFGLAKYLKLEKIKNMILIEKSKKLELFNPQKERVEQKKKVDDENEYSGLAPVKGISTNIDYNGYVKFKKQFIDMKKRHPELRDYFSFKEDYLLFLFTSFQESNISLDSLIENPVVLLNYIYTEVPDKEGKMSEVEFLAKKRQMHRLRSKSYFGNANDFEPKKYSENDFTLRPKRERMMSNIEEIIAEKEPTSRRAIKQKTKLMFTCCFQTAFTVAGIQPEPVIPHSPPRLPLPLNSKNASERKRGGSIVSNNTEVKAAIIKRKKSQLRHMSATNFSVIEKQCKQRSELLNQTNESVDINRHISQEAIRNSKVHLKYLRKSNKDIDESSIDNFKLSHTNSPQEEDNANKNSLDPVHNDIIGTKENLELVEKIIPRHYSITSLIENSAHNNSKSNIRTNVKTTNKAASPNVLHSSSKKKHDYAYDRLLPSTNMTTNNSELNKDSLVRLLLQAKIKRSKEMKKTTSLSNKQSFVKNCSSSFISETSAKTKPSNLPTLPNQNEQRYRKVSSQIEEIKASLSKDEDEEGGNREVDRPEALMDSSDNSSALIKPLKREGNAKKSDSEEDKSRNNPEESKQKQVKIASYKDSSSHKAKTKSEVTSTQEMKISEEMVIKPPKPTEPLSIAKNESQKEKKEPMTLSIKELLSDGVEEVMKELKESEEENETPKQSDKEEETYTRNQLDNKRDTKRSGNSSYQYSDKSNHEDLLLKYKKIQSLRSGRSSSHLQDTPTSQQEGKLSKESYYRPSNVKEERRMSSFSQMKEEEKEEEEEEEVRRGFTGFEDNNNSFS